MVRRSKKREAVLSAAQALFIELGFAGATMDAVAERAGVSKQTVYSHFQNKEGLFAAAVAEHCVVYQLDADFFSCYRPPTELLPVVARQFSELLLGHEPLQVYRLCVTQEQPEISRLFFEAGPEGLLNILAGYLREVDLRGALCVQDPALAAQQFLSMLRGVAQLRAAIHLPLPEAEEIERYQQSCVEMFLKAYAAS